ncbi:MAG TPA: hypothetical protein VL068_12250, partial [Microthrixaceae bacterium]|nr:hypothetical protein [Microthrixaceae bacterium]
ESNEEDVVALFNLRFTNGYRIDVHIIWNRTEQCDVCCHVGANHGQTTEVVTSESHIRGCEGVDDMKVGDEIG